MDRKPPLLPLSGSSFIGNAALWKSLSAAVKTEAVRSIKSAGKEGKEPRYYITGYRASAEVMGKAVRSHQGIENRLHRQVDVSFSEDLSRKRKGYVAQNFSLINRMVLNLIKQEQSKKEVSEEKDWMPVGIMII
jgi:predicted transposase YbfD/YdcC